MNWISIAMVANVTAQLVDMGWNARSLSDQSHAAAIAGGIA
ncbi:MAG: hypothetical protein ACUVTR_00645 [Dehalococcoidia bacterium]